jgi:tetratricopeptide (TPR) repeat protein
VAKHQAPSEAVEALLAAEEWTRARRAIEIELRLSPDSHWLLSRLALTYYEQRDYKRALEIERAALRLAPRCPLSLWGLAGSHDMLGQSGDAAALYLRLIRRGEERLAYGTCGEGLRWARGLVADCWYRLGAIREKQGDVMGARAALRRHLSRRRGGASIYGAHEARFRLKALASTAESR